MITVNNKHITQVQLYREYLAELSRYDPSLAYLTRKDAFEIVKEYMEEDKTEWLDIKEGDRIVGFFIVSKEAVNCHPDADYEICQIYVKPDYRRRGLASTMVLNYISKHHGLLSLDIIDGNNIAVQFWNKTMLKAHARYVELTEVRNYETAHNLNLHGFRIDKELVI